MNRKDEMNYLHRQKAWTLREIAEYFHISHQRVSQVIGKSNSARRNISESKIIPENSSDLSVREIQDIVFQDLKSPVRMYINKKIAGIHHHVYGGNLESGISGENAVSEILGNNGIENTLMPFGHHFDILVKDVKIDVKTAATTSNLNKHYNNEYYRFRIRKQEKSDCDFFIFYIFTNDIWIVPFMDLPDVEMVYIPVVVKKKSSINWNKYLNRFDLLQEPQP